MSIAHPLCAVWSHGETLLKPSLGFGRFALAQCGAGYFGPIAPTGMIYYATLFVFWQIHATLIIISYQTFHTPWSVRNSLGGECNKIGRILPMEVATAKCQLAAGIH